MDTENIINEVETTDGHKNGIRNEVSELITGFIKNKNRSVLDRVDNLIIGEFKRVKEFLRLNENLIVVDSGKTNHSVVMEKIIIIIKLIRR